MKKGRARFVDETTICLACPPKEGLEGFIMDENKELAEQVLPEEELTVAYVLQQIENVRKNMTYLEAALEQMQEETLQTGAKAAGAEALRDAVMARETTNQQLIAFYRNVYEDIKPESAADAKRQFIIDLIKSVPVGPDMPEPDYGRLLHEISGLDLN